MELQGLLATSSRGFGIHFDILETNLVNLAIVIGVLVYFGRKLLGKTLLERQEEIGTEIREAEQRCREAEVQLEQQRQKLAQAQSEAVQIRTRAEASAQEMKAAILAQAAKDVERMREQASQDLKTEQDRAIAQLRQQVVAMALQRAEGQLPTRLTDDVQQQLVDRSIALLGGRS